MDLNVAIGMTTGLAFSMLCCTLIVCIKLDAILRQLRQAEKPADRWKCAFIRERRSSARLLKRLRELDPEGASVYESKVR